jgi:hypothetical protein
MSYVSIKVEARVYQALKSLAGSEYSSPQSQGI